MLSKSETSLIHTARSIVCKYYGIDDSLLDIKRRKRPITEKRHIAMALLKRNTKLSFEKIGYGFCNVMDHTTVCHAKKTVENLCDTDPIYKKEFDAIEKEFVDSISTNMKLYNLIEKIRRITNKRFWKNIYFTTLAINNI